MMEIAPNFYAGTKAGNFARMQVTSLPITRTDVLSHAVPVNVSSSETVE